MTRSRAWRRGVEVALMLLLAGTTAAFGGVEPWAYVPLWWCALALLGCALLVRDRPPGRPPLLLPAVVFAAWAALQLLPFVDGRPVTVSPPDTLRGLCFLATATALHVTAWVVLASQAARRRFAWFVALLGLAAAVLGLVQLASDAPRIYWRVTTASPNFFGPFANRNHFAAFMLLVIPVAGSVLGREVRRWMAGSPAHARRPLLRLAGRLAPSLALAFVVAVVTLAALVATLSRGALLALAGAAVLVLATRRSRMVLPALAIAVTVVAAFGVERLERRFALAGHDAPERLDAWRATVPVIRDRWISGVGFNAYGYGVFRPDPWPLPAGATPWPAGLLQDREAGLVVGTVVPESAARVVWYDAAHNDWLQVAAETGVPGLLIALWAAAAALWRSRGTPWAVSLAAVMLHAVVEFHLQVPAVALLTVAVAAAGAAEREERAAG